MLYSFLNKEFAKKRTCHLPVMGYLPLMSFHKMVNYISLLMGGEVVMYVVT